MDENVEYEEREDEFDIVSFCPFLHPPHLESHFATFCFTNHRKTKPNN